MALHYSGEVTPFFGRQMIDELYGPMFAGFRVIIVAPDALKKEDWTSKRNENAVVWLTKSVMKTYAINPKKVVLTGFSMGGIGTWQIANRNQDLFTSAVPIAGEPGGNEIEWTIPVLAIHSTADSVLPFTKTAKHVEQLKSQGKNVERLTLTKPSRHKEEE